VPTRRTERSGVLCRRESGEAVPVPVALAVQLRRRRRRRRLLPRLRRRRLRLRRRLRDRPRRVRDRDRRERDRVARRREPERPRVVELRRRLGVAARGSSSLSSALRRPRLPPTNRPSGPRIRVRLRLTDERRRPRRDFSAVYTQKQTPADLPYTN